MTRLPGDLKEGDQVTIEFLVVAADDKDAEALFKKAGADIKTMVVPMGVEAEKKEESDKKEKKDDEEE